MMSMEAPCPLRDRLARSLRGCDADLGSPLARGLFANRAYAPAGVVEEGPVDYEALAGWLLGHHETGTPPGKAAAAPLETPRVVRLNVGGCLFATRSSTLAKAPPGSLLRGLPLGPPDGSGCYYICRDGGLFAYVLNFLRDSDHFAVPTDLAERQGLYREACHYGLTGLARAVQGAGCCQGAPCSRVQQGQPGGMVESSDAERAGAARLDCLTATAKFLLDMPAAMISLSDDDPRRSSQGCRLSCAVAPRSTVDSALGSLPQDLEVLVIEDTDADPRTRGNPPVVEGRRIRFYAGCPLVAHDGSRLGALCVTDHAPRKLMQWQCQLLVSLSYLAVQELQRADLERARRPLGGCRTIDELVPTPASSSSGSAARLEALRRSRDGPAPGPTSCASGALRLTRMREAIKEMVCLVQVSWGSMHWPLLYANQPCSDLLDFQVPPMDFALELDKPGRPDELGDRPGFWDRLALDAGAEKEALLQCVRAAWEAQSLPHVFGLTAAAAPSGGRGARQVSCRFAPVQELR
ncbi:unnamed protein product, partial [Prorocentrum cordatum]